MSIEQPEIIEELPVAETSSVEEETAEAQAEAAAIGGTGTADADPAQQAVREAGGGEAEGFELAEEALIDNASHGDQHAARQILETAPASEAEPDPATHGEADGEDGPA